MLAKMSDFKSSLMSDLIDSLDLCVIMDDDLLSDVVTTGAFTVLLDFSFTIEVEDVLADENVEVDVEVGDEFDEVFVFVNELLFVDELPFVLLNMLPLLLLVVVFVLLMDEFNLRSSIIGGDGFEFDTTDVSKLLSFRIICVGDCCACELFSELSKMTLGVFFKLPDGSFTAEFD